MQEQESVSQSACIYYSTTPNMFGKYGFFWQWCLYIEMDLEMLTRTSIESC